MSKKVYAVHVADARGCMLPSALDKFPHETGQAIYCGTQQDMQALLAQAIKDDAVRVSRSKTGPELKISAVGVMYELTCTDEAYDNLRTTGCIKADGITVDKMSIHLGEDLLHDAEVIAPGEMANAVAGRWSDFLELDKVLRVSTPEMLQQLDISNPATVASLRQMFGTEGLINNGFNGTQETQAFCDLIHAMHNHELGIAYYTHLPEAMEQYAQIALKNNAQSQEKNSTIGAYIAADALEKLTPQGLNDEHGAQVMSDLRKLCYNACFRSNGQIAVTVVNPSDIKQGFDHNAANMTVVQNEAGIASLDTSEQLWQTPTEFGGKHLGMTAVRVFSDAYPGMPVVDGTRPNLPMVLGQLPSDFKIPIHNMNAWIAADGIHSGTRVHLSDAPQEIAQRQKDLMRLDGMLAATPASIRNEFNLEQDSTLRDAARRMFGDNGKFSAEPRNNHMGAFDVLEKHIMQSPLNVTYLEALSRAEDVYRQQYQYRMEMKDTDTRAQAYALTKAMDVLNQHAVALVHYAFNHLDKDMAARESNVASILQGLTDQVQGSLAYIDAHGQDLGTDAPEIDGLDEQSHDEL